MEPNKVRLLTLRSGLKLECLGMRRRGRSCYAIVKEEFGLTGGKTAVLEKFDLIVIERTGVPMTSKLGRVKQDHPKIIMVPVKPESLGAQDGR